MYTWAAPPFLSGGPERCRDHQGRGAYARSIFTESGFPRRRLLSQRRTLDSFNGISTYFGVWGALAAEAPLPRKAIAKVYDLRAHLTLPEPDGTLLGPSHMASLTSAESAHEQWDWPMRTWGAALIADEAACLTKMPDEAQLQKALELVVGEINAQLHELSWTPGGLDPAPWTHQPAGTLVNFAYQYYPKGYYARRMALEKQGRPVQLPVLREDRYIRNFKDELVVAKPPEHAAIVHVGPIADSSNAHPVYGFGGGALSAFWTPLPVRSSSAAASARTRRSTRSRSRNGGRCRPRRQRHHQRRHRLHLSPHCRSRSDRRDWCQELRGSAQRPHSSFRHDDARKLSGGSITHGSLSPAQAASASRQRSRPTRDKIAELYEVVPVFLRGGIPVQGDSHHHRDSR